MRVCYQTGHTLGSSCAPKHPCPLLETSLTLRLGVEPLQLLVEHPLDSALGDPEVTRAEPLVEAANPLLPGDLLDHVQARNKGLAGGRFRGFCVVRS